MDHPPARTLPDDARADEHAFLAGLLPVVATWCARLAAPGVDADAAAHDVLLVLLRRRAELRPDVSPLPWAYAVTRQVLRAHGRTSWLRRWLPGAVRDRPAPSDPQRDYAGAERARLVADVLGGLDEAHREVLVLCDVEERSRAEVAALLGVPTGTVKSRLRLAREAFRARAARRGVTLMLLVEEPEDG
jgi:RNA polymerase sigma factor (sigma-70 family)